MKKKHLINLFSLAPDSLSASRPPSTEASLSVCIPTAFLTLMVLIGGLFPNLRHGQPSYAFYFLSSRHCHCFLNHDPKGLFHHFLEGLRNQIVFQDSKLKRTPYSTFRSIPMQIAKSGPKQTTTKSRTNGFQCHCEDDTSNILLLLVQAPIVPFAILQM